MNKRAVIGFVLAISAIFALNGSALTFADEGAQFSITVGDAVLQLTVPQAANIELNPTSSSAVFGSTNLNLNVATNNITGYRVVMSVSNTNLTHNALSNTVISTLSAASTESNFPTNAWGYKVVGDDYHPILTSNVPDSWASDGPTNGTNYTMALAAKVDGTKPAGTYTNTLNFQVITIPNVPKDTIVFNGNGATSGSMANQVVFQGEYTDLTTNAFAKTGYAFNGWNTNANGLGVGYGDGASYRSPITNTAASITLYAQWICDSSVNTCDGVPSVDTGGSGGYAGKTLQDAYEMAYVTNPGNFREGGNNKHGLYVPEKDPVTGNYTGNYFEATKASDYEGIPANDLRFALQDIDLKIGNVKICDYTTVIGSEAHVLDLRDYKSYWIAKLADGKCWMTQNLDFDLDSTKDYTNEDTDIGWNGTEYTATTWRPSSSTVHSKSNYTNSSNTPQSLDLGDYYYDGTYTYSSCDIIQGGCGYSANISGKTREHGHIGNHYNAPATFATNNTSQIVLSETDRSICPKGWKLPSYIKSSGTYEITTLYQKYGLRSGLPGATPVLYNAPLYFVTAGVPSHNVGGGYQGWYRYGSYGNNGGIIIILYHGATPFAGGNYFEHSVSVRCLAR